MKIQTQNSSRGFTLIELLVAMAITTLIVTILVSITALSLDTWNRSRSEIRAARQGKAMIDSMAQDFESLVIRKGNSFEWLFAKSIPTASGPKGNASPNAVEMVFFSAATDRYEGQIGSPTDEGGDVSTIAYQLSYKDPLQDEDVEKFKTFVLYRKIENPDDTFTNNLGQASLENIVDDISAEQNFICENVYQFTVTFHLNVTKSSATGNTLTPLAISVGQNTDATEQFSITGNGIVVDADFATSAEDSEGQAITLDDIKAAQITSVEISLTVLTDFGLKQMQSRDIATGAPLDEFIAENSYHFSKMVTVPGS